MNRLVLWLLLSLLGFSCLIEAKPLPIEKIPEPLKPWVDWVLHEFPERDCPFVYYSFPNKHCTWTTELSLSLTASKGSFNQRVQVFKKENTWILLPGDRKHWPLSVTVNDKTALVMENNGRPAIKLFAGTYQIKGDFLWDSIPENLMLPEDTGLISLQMNGQTIPMPIIKNGQLWLKESDRGQAKPENVQNRIDIQIFRKIIDEVPLNIVTHLDLEVSGQQREEKITGTVLAGFIPLQVQCPLPARLEANGQLVIQVRPGRWTCQVFSRSTKETNQLTLPKEMAHTEVWVFEARPELRIVEVEQLQTIDASQTNLPDEWRNLPAYRLNPEQSMNFKVVRRGDPEPEPNRLNLTRKLWLDFDGTGYTINDTITGKMTSGWRLNTLPETKLGKVTLDGDSQLITKQSGSNKEGVEVRKGSLNLDADSRVIGHIGHISAVGWEQKFQQVNAELNLPPGWRLIAATGVDNVPDSWLARWTLWDLFLVLITAIATGKLWNRYWGIFALVTLTIIWHEPDAPQFVWLHILAATALLKVLPQSKFFTVISWYRRVCWLVLVSIVLPFMIEQVRIGIYPQLERPWQAIYQENNYPGRNLGISPMPATAPPPMQAAKPIAPAPMEENEIAAADAPIAEAKPDFYNMTPESVDKLAGKMEQRVLRKKAEPTKQASVMQSQNNVYDFERVDPKAKVQTGPGLPQWQWHTVKLSWNGAVDTEHELSLWYLSPTLTMLLNFLRVILVALLGLLMIVDNIEKFIPPSLLNKWKLTNQVSCFLLCLLALTVAIPSQNVYADDFPDNELLEQLRAKVQEEVVPDCLPSCATIQQMAMTITDKEIEIKLQVHAQESVILPLPADYGQWFPNQVLVDDKAADALYRENNKLWLHLKQGEHQVAMKGVPPLLSKFTIPFIMKPKRVVVEKTGWDVFGLEENGWADDQLQFSRSQQVQQTDNKPLLEQGALPPFVRVERLLQLGLDWRVITQITRLSPADSAVVLSVPLLKGERVTTENIRVKDGAVEVNMAAQQTFMQWESSLARTDKIELTAPATEQWVEVWQADISPVWHIDTAGIAMIHLNNTEQWLPEWHPWANEKMTLTITRPESVAGQTLTIDNSRLNITQGKRMRDVLLKASLRSSQGMQHTLTLPEKAQLQSVSINGRSQPLRLEGRKLTLPINPGKQEISLVWQEPSAISPLLTSSDIDLGQDSVNHNMTIGLGQDRWVLFAFGPKIGPIILFWGLFVVIIMVSFGLAKIPLTPLKSWQWLLLLIGLSQLPLMAASVVVAWLMILGWRAKATNELTKLFNPIQVGIALLTLIALAILCSAVAHGLLNSPDMLVTGNHSSAFVLNWYQDRSNALLPKTSVISLPILAYRILMLAWALWLASSLLNWLKWGWQCFSNNGIWRKKVAETKTENEQTDSIDLSKN